MPIDPQQFKRTLTYNITATSDRILQDLEEITHLDREAEKKQSQFGKAAGVSIAAAIVFFLIAIFVTPFFGVLAALALVIAIVLGAIAAFGMGRLNLPNYRYERTQQVMSMLQRDIDPNTEFHLTVDFESAMCDRKRTSKESHPYRQGWQMELFRDPWLNLAGEFLDGTDFELSVTEIHQRASGTKRSSSGKIKHKSKAKFKGFLLVLTLHVRPRRYGAIQLFQNNLAGAVKLPDGAELKGLKVEGKALKMGVKLSRATSPESEDIYEAIAAMFLSLYQALNLARTLSKKSSA